MSSGFGGTTGIIDAAGGSLGDTAGGSAGDSAGGAAGGSAVASDVRAVRGFTDAEGVHAVVFATPGSSTITELTGTPLGNSVDLGGNPMARSTPWGYRRHDGPAVIAYVDTNGHIHERGTLDFDFALSFGINAPIASGPPADPAVPTPDVIGYVRSDNQSALVYRASNNHVIEVRSNFSGQPPWLATDLTSASGARVTATTGSAFPYVRSDGWNAIVYIASDNHIHELTSLGSGWQDADLSAAAGDTVVPITDPSGYRRSDGGNSVVYVGNDLEIHDLTAFPGRSSWSSSILPAVSPLGGIIRRPSGYARVDGLNAVVYVSGSTTNQSVHELVLGSNGWTDAALPAPSASSIVQPFGHQASGGRSSVLFQATDAQGAVSRYELSLPLGGSWGLQAF